MSRQAPVTGSGWSLTTSRDQQRDPKPAVVARKHGVDVDNVEYPSSTSGIGAKPDTAYGIRGPLTYDGVLDNEGADNVAIVAVADDARIPIPARDRGYDVLFGGEGTSDVLWHGVALDQREPGAWGRMNAAVDGGAIIKALSKIGSGRRANPTPNQKLENSQFKSGPGLYAPALKDGRQNRIIDLDDVHGGVVASEHYGDRPIGIWLGGNHEGELHIVGGRIAQYGNNALYATATPGEVYVRGTTFRNCGVSNGRIARGAFENVTSIYDSSDSAGLANADASRHATQGLAVEAKKKGQGGSVAIVGCTVRMGAVARCGGGIDVRSGRVSTVENTDVHISDRAEWGDEKAPDIIVDGVLDQLRNVDLSGSATSGTSIINRGSRIQADGLTIDYPGSRGNYQGPVST